MQSRAAGTPAPGEKLRPANPRCISSGLLTGKGSNICRITEKRSSCIYSAFSTRSKRLLFPILSTQESRFRKFLNIPLGGRVGCQPVVLALGAVLTVPTAKIIRGHGDLCRHQEIGGAKSQRSPRAAVSPGEPSQLPQLRTKGQPAFKGATSHPTGLRRAPLQKSFSFPWLREPGVGISNLII